MSCLTAPRCAKKSRTWHNSSLRGDLLAKFQRIASKTNVAIIRRSLLGLGLLLIPTLGGYWFLTRLYYTRYGILRDSGYHILFKSAIVGCSLFVGSRLLVVFFLNPLLPYIGEIWKSYVPHAYSGTVTLSVLLGGVLPLVINMFYRREKAARRTARESGDLIELLIRENIGREEFVELSLRSGKSYIGLVIESGIARHGESDVALVPMASGYRKEETHELEITTNYAPVISKSLQESSATSAIIYEDFRIVIPMSEIVSARIFDPKVYELFQQEELSE